MAENQPEKISKLFSLNYIIPRARVVGFSHTDELIALTLKKSDIDKPFLFYADAKPGEKVSVR